MPWAALRAHGLLVVSVLVSALAAALAVALTADLLRAAPGGPSTSEVGCPAGLSAAVAERSVVAGTYTATVHVVPPSGMQVPVSGPLRNACVLRVSYIFQPKAGVSYQAMTPGGRVTLEAIGASLLRSGWVAGGGGRMLGPGGRTAQLSLFSPTGFLASLPPSFRMPPSSAYAHDTIAVLTVLDPAKP